MIFAVYATTNIPVFRDGYGREFHALAGDELAVLEVMGFANQPPVVQCMNLFGETFWAKAYEIQATDKECSFQVVTPKEKAV